MELRLVGSTHSAAGEPPEHLHHALEREEGSRKTPPRGSRRPLRPAVRRRIHHGGAPTAARSACDGAKSILPMPPHPSVMGPVATRVAETDAPPGRKRDALAASTLRRQEGRGMRWQPPLALPGRDVPTTYTCATGNWYAGGLHLRWRSGRGMRRQTWERGSWESSVEEGGLRDGREGAEKGVTQGSWEGWRESSKDCASETLMPNLYV